MSVADITVTELKERLDKKEEIVLLDVREVHENQEFNLGGTLIPLGDLPIKLSQLEDYKDKEVIVYCRSGKRSGRAKEFMLQNGFSHVRNLLGGVLDWQDKKFS